MPQVGLQPAATAGRPPPWGKDPPAGGQGHWGTLATGHGNTRGHPQGAGAAHLPRPSRRRSRSPAPRRRHVPGGCSGRWRSGTPGGRRRAGGSRARRSRRRSRARRRSGRPRARTAPRRSGAGGGRSAGRRPRPSRPRSRPRCRRARRPARSARWCGRGTPSRGSGAGAGRAGRRGRIATARPRTCCGAAGAQSWCVVPACPLCTRCRSGTRDGDTPTRTPLTSSCSPAAPRRRAGRRCPPRHTGTRRGRCSCPLPPKQGGVGEHGVGQPHGSPRAAPRSPCSTFPSGQKQPSRHDMVSQCSGSSRPKFWQVWGQGGPQALYSCPPSHCMAAEAGGQGAVSCQPWGKQDPQPGPPSPSPVLGTGTHGTGPGSSSGCGHRAGRTPRRRWQWPCTGTRSPPRSHSCRKGTAGWWGRGRDRDRRGGGSGPPPGGVCGPAPTRRHRRHTSRRSAGTAPPRGRAQRAAA